MPATSKSQQRFFGMVHAAQQGGKGTKNPRIAKVARKMSPQSVGHFAGTKHKHLPEKKGSVLSLVARAAAAQAQGTTR